MHALIGKKILIVGDENQQIKNLDEQLKINGALISNATCDAVTKEKIESEDIDALILNHLHESDICRTLLLDLRNSSLPKVTPIFVLVEDNEEKIEEAYALGAADYIVPQEETSSIIAKIKTVIGGDADAPSNSDIDITPEETNLTKTGVRVYVVEDDPLLRNLLSIKLEKSSFPFEFSNDGRNVIESMIQFKPDIVILDLMLPGKSGFEVLDEIKSHEKLKAVPVLVFSNRDGQDDKHKAKELGAVGFYVKAMTDLSELIKTIESHVA